jgi:cytochrome bd-type quinol oxidase subunit 2
MKKLVLLFITVITLLITSVDVMAQAEIGGCEGAAAESALCKDFNTTGNPLFGSDGILTRVANIFATLTGLISVFMVIIGGMRYINSAGDSAKTATAKNTIMYAAIGMGVALSAGGIVRFILNGL